MNKLKKTLICLILSLTIISTNLLSVMAQTTDISSINEPNNPSSQSEYTLSWNYLQDGKVLEKVTKGKTDYTYTYNDNKNRILKTSENETIVYYYDNESRLISEVRGDNTFTYLYDSQNSLIGFTLNDIPYNFVKDNSLNVIALTDADNNYLAKYEYNKKGITSSISGKDTSGKWVDMSKDSSFIGTLNQIRLHSFYYDVETGLYYNGYQYYDSSTNKYVGGTDNLSSISTFEDFKKNTVSKLVSPTLISQIFSWQNSLMSSPTFGTPITTYTSSWYNSLSDVEILSRLFYGENTSNSFDQNAVTWVVINRKSNGNFGSTYRAIATASGQFEPITGGLVGTTNARIPDTSNPRWSNAVYLACCLLSTSSISDYTDLISKPTGISSQLYFVGLNYLLSNFSNGLPISKDAVPAGSGLMYSFNKGSSYVKMKDVVIVFTTSDTFRNPGSKNIIITKDGLKTYSERSTHNIFFNY